MAGEFEKSIAAVSAWSARPATSHPVDGATPHSAEVATNPAKPVR
jgi:hypothetical protein